MTAPLLEAIRGLIERTYAMRSGLAEIGPFVIGDQGLRTLYEAREVADIGTATEGAKTLVRETADGVAACVYFPDEMIRQLEAYPPTRGLGEENLDAFAAFVEEIDHLLVIAERSLGRRPVSLFELELHADVSKYMVLARFLAGRPGTLDERHRIWLRRRLFDSSRVDDDDPSSRERYRDASRWAVRMLDGLDALEPRRRLGFLRRFHRAPVAAKLRQIDRVKRR